MKPHLAILLPTVVGLLAIASPAQRNWVVNGDFENGVKGWTISGPGGTPGIVSYDTDGMKKSNAYSVQAGGNSYSPPHKPLVLTQTILAVPGTTYELFADIAISGPNGNAQAGIFEVKIGGVSVAKKDFGRYTGNSNPRDRLCERFQLKKAGNVTFQVELSRPKYIWSKSTPRLFIDNIQLRLVNDPIFCIKGDRKLGSSASWELHGVPKSVFAVFLAPKLLPKPVPIPGFSGLYGLDVATTIPLYSGVLDTTGMHAQPFRMPLIIALDKTPLYIQALQLSPTRKLSFGPFHNWGFHR